MSGILQSIVQTVNNVSSSCLSVFTSFITFNYHIGDILVKILHFFSVNILSLLNAIFTALKITLEDFVVFLEEVLESVGCVIHFFVTSAENVFNSVCEGVLWTVSIFSSCWEGFLSTLSTLQHSCAQGLQSASSIFSLLGESILLLFRLIPSTLSLLYVGSRQLIVKTSKAVSETTTYSRTILSNTSPEMYLGLVVGSLSLLALVRLLVTTVRDSNITWETLLRAGLRGIAQLYILFIRSIARFIGLIFTVVEMTVSNVRVPMFNHPGDSEDEDEDRENLVGPLQESDDEENERIKERKRNFQLLLERSSKKKGSRRNSTDSVEEELIREVEREREDKLCVICQDAEKCIMILPCRHLCICEGCQGPLRSHRNTCPICRKPVKQTIKAYM